MRKIFKLFLLILLFIGSSWAIRYLIATNKKENIIYTTTTAFKTDISKKAVVTGLIKAKEDVEIKPNVSGIIKEIKVQEGDIVKKERSLHA